MEPARLRQQLNSGGRNQRRLIHDGKPTGSEEEARRRWSWFSALGQKATFPATVKIGHHRFYESTS